MSSFYSQRSTYNNDVGHRQVLTSARAIQTFCAWIEGLFRSILWCTAESCDECIAVYRYIRNNLSSLGVCGTDANRGDERSANGVNMTPSKGRPYIPFQLRDYCCSDRMTYPSCYLLIPLSASAIIASSRREN
jgi:hypothetical protein